MGLFTGAKEWFFPKMEYRDNVRDLVEYLTVGNLENLVAWTSKWIPYRFDTVNGKENGKYDPLQNYNGADLTIRAKWGDCESIAAVFEEVIIEWKGWGACHVGMVYDNGTAHDVCRFTKPNGETGWIDGAVFFGDWDDMREYYDSIGWHIIDWAIENDLGEDVKAL